MDKIKHPKRFFVLLIVLATIGPVALNMPIPAMPDLIKGLNTTPEMAQLTLTLYLLGMGLSQIIMGPLSDRFGRRPIVLIGMASGTVFSIIASLATSIEVLIAARLLQAIGATCGVILGRAMIRDLFPQDKAASMMGYVTMGMMIGPMVTPYLGGLLTESFGWHTLFYVIAVMTALAGAFAFVELPETRKEQDKQGGVKKLLLDIKELSSSKKFWLYCMIGSFSSATFFAITGGSPYIVITMMGNSPSDFGKWIALNAFGYAVGNYVSGKYATKKGIDVVISWGVGVGLIGAILMLVFYAFGWITSLFWFFFPQFFIATANGMQLPTSMAGALSINARIAGSAAGLNGFTQMCIGAIISQICGTYVAQYNSVLPLVIALFSCVIITNLSLYYVRKLK